MPKISELNAITAVSNDDLIIVVNDPAGLPATNKITVGNFNNSIANVVAVIVGNTIAQQVINSITLANTTAAGIVIVGDNLSTNATGHISVGYANNTAAGVIKVGNNLTINSTSGVLDAQSGLPTNGTQSRVLISDAAGNASWAKNPGLDALRIVNAANTYTATSTDNNIFCDPNAISQDITIVLPITGGIQGKRYSVKNLNNSGGGLKVRVTTDNPNSNFIEHPITGQYVLYYDILLTNDQQEWIFDGTYYRHTGSLTSAPIFLADANTFHQVVVKNISTEINASSDLVLYNDLGNYEQGLGPFVDLGINSSIYSNTIYSLGGPSDAYLFNSGGDFAIGTGDPSTNLVLHAGGTTNNSVQWIFDPTGTLTLPANGNITGDIVPSANTAYSLGSANYRWDKLWVGSNSVIFSDTNPVYPDQVLTVSEGIFNITTAGVTSNAGLRVGNFTFVNNYILLSNTAQEIIIGQADATGPVIFNRPIDIVSGETGKITFAADRSGRVQLLPPAIPAGDVGAFSIIGSTNGAFQGVVNPGGMLHITGNDGVVSRITNDGFGTGAFPAYISRAGRGTANTPSAVQSGDIMSRYSTVGWGTTTFPTGPAPNNIEVHARENFTDTASGAEYRIFTTPIGTVSKALSATVNDGGISLVNTSNTSSGITFRDASRQTTAFNSTSAVTKINVGTGLTQSANVGIVGIDATGVLSVTGTANQISVSASGQNLTLSLPQNLNTNASVTFGTVTVENLVVTGGTTTANTLSVVDKVIHLAPNTDSSSQIDGGGITLGNTEATYHVSFLYDLGFDRWDTNGGGLKTLNLYAEDLEANSGSFRDQLHIGTAYLGYDFPDAILQADEDINSYGQVVNKNHSTGTQASADFVAVNDIGTDSANYIDMGINSSNYANNDYSAMGPNDGYMYVNGGSLAIGTQTVGTGITFFVGNTTADAIVGSIDASGWYFDHIAITGNTDINALNANGSIGSAGQVLSSDGTKAYWSTTIGYAGSRGSTGFTGSIGSDGFTGSKGDLGYTGSFGATGYVGSKGDTGSVGPTGYTGSIGSTGFTGSKGDLGYAGSFGATGYTGSVGSQGTTGFTGSVGSAGYTGSVGLTGTTGFTGSIGASGYAGSQGDLGYTGSQGVGYTGSQGDLGYTGSFGSLGYTGSVGYTGSSGSLAGSNNIIITSTGIDYTITRIDGLQRVVTGNASSTYAVSNTEQYIGTTRSLTSTGTITLPLGSTVPPGRQYIIKDEGGLSGSSFRRITVAASGSDTIDGTATKGITSNYGALTLLWTGTIWSVI